MVAVGDSNKHIVQIVQLLDERKLSFSFCLNRNEVLVQAGFGLLFQTLNLNRDGKLIKDCNRLTCTVMDMLDRGSAAGAHEFRRVGSSMITVPRVEHMTMPALPRHSMDGTMAAPIDRFRATQKSLKAIAARFSPGAVKATIEEAKEPRRATLPAISPGVGIHPNPSTASLSSIRSEPPLSPLSQRSAFSAFPKRRPSHRLHQNRNIDYLSFGPDALNAYSTGLALPSTTIHKADVSSSDWERLLSSLDNGQANIYDGIYGGQPPSDLLDLPPLSASTEPSLSWSPPHLWTWGSYGNGNGGSDQAVAPPQSVLSFSDESLTSGEEFVGGGNTSSGGEFGTPGSEARVFTSLMMGDLGNGLGLVGPDGNFGL